METKEALGYKPGVNCPNCGEAMGSQNCTCFEECSKCANPMIACECEKE